MLLSRSEFDQKLKNKNLALAFIGMSNIGKSYRARELHKKRGFDFYCVDRHIAESLDMSSEAEMAKWLGYPYEKRFQENQKIYLEHEGRLTKNAPRPKYNNFVLDTTGSVIYLSEEVLSFLKNNFLIVHFPAPENMRERLCENYFANPKPVMWGESFRPRPEESGDEALRRCYPELLDYRLKKYFELADISVDIFQKKPMAHEIFWKKLKSALPDT